MRWAVASGLRTFTGVAHRLELVAVRDGVSYVNDSKATNVASTVVALRAYEHGIHLIAGGRGKRQDYAPLAPLVAERCRAVYLIGEAAGELADALKETDVPLHLMHDLRDAVSAAPPGLGFSSSVSSRAETSSQSFGCTTSVPATAR